MLGIGIGGTAEKAMLLAKESLMEDIDMFDLKQRGARSDVEKLRVELFDKVNALGIGAQGLGGLTTVLDIKIKMYPTHAVGKPVAMIPNCAATRHAHFELDGSGPAYIEPPSLDLWPDVNWQPDYNRSTRVNLDTLTREEVASWARPDLLLNGRMLTGQMQRTSASPTCWQRKSNCLSTHQSLDLLRDPSIPCAMKWSAPRVQRLQHEWTSSLT